MAAPKPKYYPAREEQLNIWSHAIGGILSIAGLVLLLMKATTLTGLLSSAIYGSSMIFLYAASTRYHSEKNEVKRARYRIMDHAAIFVFIAGTYTPFALVALGGNTGRTLIVVIWGIAVLGVVLKSVFTGRFLLLSTVLYVGMGWIALLFVQPLMERVEERGLLLLGAGGAAYTIGAILYSLKKMPYHHAIFHFFVLAGSLLHYFSIYFYVMEAPNFVAMLLLPFSKL